MNTQLIDISSIPAFAEFDCLTAEEVAKKYQIPLDRVERAQRAAKGAMQPMLRQILVRENGAENLISTTRIGVGILVTDEGHEFWHFAFHLDDKWKTYHVLWHGEVDIETWDIRPHDPNTLLIRTDSGCVTGQVFHDRTCDCRQQLHAAMAEIGANGEGMIIHIPTQDGRGMGLPWKLATLTLQHLLGVDTVESARMLIPADRGVIDCRTYSGVVACCRFLGFEPGVAVNLATNNPAKMRVFVENGYTVEVTPVHVPATEHTARHFQAKNAHLGHTLPPSGDEK